MSKNTTNIFQQTDKSKFNAMTVSPGEKCQVLRQTSWKKERLLHAAILDIIAKRLKRMKSQRNDDVLQKMFNIISLILFTLKHPISSFELSGCYRFLSTLSQDEELFLMLDCLVSIYKELSLETASHLYEKPLLSNLLSLFGPCFQWFSLS